MWYMSKSHGIDTISLLHTTATGLESQDETRGENETSSIESNKALQFKRKILHKICWTFYLMDMQ